LQPATVHQSKNHGPMPQDETDDPSITPNGRPTLSMTNLMSVPNVAEEKLSTDYSNFGVQNPSLIHCYQIA